MKDNNMKARIVAVATATKKALLQNKNKKKKRQPVTCISGDKKPHTIEELKKEGEFRGILNKLL